MPVTELRALPRPVPGGIWEIILMNGVRVRGPVFVEDNVDRPSGEWTAVLHSPNGDRFIFSSRRGGVDSVDLRKRADTPHPMGWAYTKDIGWHPREEGVLSDGVSAGSTPAPKGRPNAGDPPPAVEPEGGLPISGRA
ncbi:MAG: hypothetical protein ABIK09_21200 [Pseudomonadota bacterium]